MTALLAWLIGSATGRTIALLTLGLLAVCLVVWRVFAAGVASEAAKAATARAAETISILQQKVRTDEEIRRMPPAARRQRLREWAAGRE